MGYTQNLHDAKDFIPGKSKLDLSKQADLAIRRGHSFSGGGELDADPLIQRILDDEGLTGDLMEAEAEKLNAWLITKAKQLAHTGRTMAEAARELDAICRKAHAAAKVLAAWRDHGDPASIAKTVGLNWKPGKNEADTFAGLLAQIG